MTAAVYAETHVRDSKGSLLEQATFRACSTAEIASRLKGGSEGGLPAAAHTSLSIVQAATPLSEEDH